MKYKLAGGNVAVSDYETASAMLNAAGLTVSEAIRNLFSYMARTHEVPESVRGTADDATTRRLAAFDELTGLVESTPHVPWIEGDSRDDCRDILEARYV